MPGSSSERAPWAGRLSLLPTGALVPAAASPPPPRCLVPFLSKQWCPLRGGSRRLLSRSALLDPPLLLPPLLPRGEGLNLLPKAPSSLGKSAVLCREDCPSLLQGLLPSGSHPPHPILRPPRQPSPSPEEPLSLPAPEIWLLPQPGACAGRFATRWHFPQTGHSALTPLLPGPPSPSFPPSRIPLSSVLPDSCPLPALEYRGS